MTVSKVVTSQQQRPLKQFAIHSTTTCAAQASVYGRCILANYTDVRKDMCKDEYAQFGECLRKAMKRAW